jgi:hypothetical protein
MATAPPWSSCGNASRLSLGRDRPASRQARTPHRASLLQPLRAPPGAQVPNNLSQPGTAAISLDEMAHDLQRHAIDPDVVPRLGTGAFHAPGGNPAAVFSTLLAILRHIPPAEASLDGVLGQVPSHWWYPGCVEICADSAALFKLGDGCEVRATEIKCDREAWNLVFRAPPQLTEQRFNRAVYEERARGFVRAAADSDGTIPPTIRGDQSGIRTNREAAAQAACRQWISQLTERPANKDAAFELAKAAVESTGPLSRKAFERAWGIEAPAKWKQGGRRRKSPPQGI